MKKSRILVIAGISVLLMGAAAYVFVIGRKPFKDLEASEIALATVQLTPPDKTVEITETGQLAEYLRNVVIYNRDSSYTSYAGQGVIFTLTMMDGTQTEIVAYNPFLIIDGVGYRTKYEPCEALSSYANGLLDVGNAPVILEEPPALTIFSDEMAGGTILGTYSWQRRNYDGTVIGIDVDSAPPLSCKDRLSRFDNSEATITLRFNKEPDEILNVRRWSDEHWDELTADSEAVTIHGYEIWPKPGGYIYEVTARWNTESGYGCPASYFFYVYSN